MKRLTSAEKASGFADESQAFVSRRLYDVPGDREYTFGIDTARRLSELSGTKNLVTPAYETDGLTTGLDDAMMLIITLGSTVADVFAGVLTTVFRTSFSAIADALFIVLKTLMEGLKMIIQSGLLPSLINLGVEFVIIYFTEIMLPLLFAAIDFVTCIVDLFNPSGWYDQLSCIADKCFRGSSARTDWLVFTSVPVLVHRFAAVMQATVNSRTGRRFIGFATTGNFKTSDRTRDPNTQSEIRAEETESASQPNPTKEFTFADDFADFLPTTGADKCGGCFVCKVPEMRILWYIIASLGSLFSEHNIATFAGNTTQNCMGNGSWYAQACGPRGRLGAEMLTYRAWRKLGYTAGFHERDTRIFDSFAGEAIERTKQMGADPLKPGLMAAAEAWYRHREEAEEQETSDAEEEEKAALFTYQMCRVMRLSDIGEYTDHGPDFHQYPGSSLSHLSAKYLYESCKRFKFEVVGQFGRSAHDFFYEVGACGQDRVVCKKDELRCLGGCSGVDGSDAKHDFSTIVTIAELSEFALGDGFDSVAAANCTVKTAILKVPTFAGGDSFGTFAARLRTRSGMTAIDTAYCENNARSCSVIQRVLERSPGLVFVNGAFRHVYSTVPPSPPPPPLPPPRTFAYGPAPPTPSPPPGTPPPYYAVCLRFSNRACTTTGLNAACMCTGCRTLYSIAPDGRLWAGHHRRRCRGCADRGTRQLRLYSPRVGGAAASVGMLLPRGVSLPPSAA